MHMSHNPSGSSIEPYLAVQPQESEAPVFYDDVHKPPTILAYEEELGKTLYCFPSKAEFADGSDSLFLRLKDPDVSLDDLIFKARKHRYEGTFNCCCCNCCESARPVSGEKNCCCWNCGLRSRQENCCCCALCEEQDEEDHVEVDVSFEIQANPDLQTQVVNPNKTDTCSPSLVESVIRL